MYNGALNFSETEAKKGYRLKYVEVYNWGTFNKRIWRFETNGESALMTGGNGSGKSTMIDAIATLLVPRRKLRYNGVPNGNERSLRSYVFGYYKKESDANGNARDVPLRGLNDYTVILAVFSNEDLGHEYTLAQVLTPKESGQPDALYVTADRSLTIKGDFAAFGGNIATLRNRLRGLQGVNLHDTASAYSFEFRAKFGIESEQSLALFGQTVSMKSIDSITNLLREHMLGSQEKVSDQVDSIITGFRDLENAHNAITVAKQQVELLKPIVEDNERLESCKAAAIGIQSLINAVEPYFHEVSIEKLDSAINSLREDHALMYASKEKKAKARKNLQTERDGIISEISKNGGESINIYTQRIQSLEKEKSDVEVNLSTYSRLLANVKLNPPKSEEEFNDVLVELNQLKVATETNFSNIRNQLLEMSGIKNDLVNSVRDIDAEIVSLSNRSSNISDNSLRIRRMVCAGIEVSESDLPYAAELIQIKDDELDWEGAIERVLHGFGVSMLVPPSLYAKVAKFVNDNNLRGRLDYFEAKPTQHLQMGAREDSMLRKLEIKEDSLFAGWLRSELNARFDYTCVDSMSSYHLERKALTKSGLHKNGIRHSKDDKKRIDDRSEYVLGWSNLTKLADLQQKSQSYHDKLRAVTKDIESINQSESNNRATGNALAQLLVVDRYEKIDLQSIVTEIARLNSKITEIESSSDMLSELKKRQNEIDEALVSLDDELSLLLKNMTQNEGAQERYEADRTDYLNKLQDFDGNLIKAHKLDIESWLKNKYNSSDIELKRLDDVRLVLTKDLNHKLNAENAKINELREDIGINMSQFRLTFLREGNDLGSKVEAMPAYLALYNEIIGEKIHELEHQFKSRMKDQATDSVMMLKQDLELAKNGLKSEIELINKLVSSIDYAKGHYIVIKAHSTNDVDVSNFLSDLQSCMDDSMDITDNYEISEERFQKVKALVERLRGRPDSVQLDLNWRRKVTDVRQWFNFAAHEMGRADNIEVECYSDSNNKSNGQKEKLAYTILAASLSHQFGLSKETESTKTFRLIIIDEAFSNASPENTQYGLELFKRMKFQMVVATPMIKIDVIEPYVQQVGHASINLNKDNSSFINMSIQSYRNHPKYMEARASEEAAA